ncbi:MAG: long-chain fatty acid--CoA ligase [Treponemataceae bacterium]
MLVHLTALNPRPDAPAFIFKGQIISYGRFAELIRVTRNYLYSRGVRPGDRVGLLCRNSPDFVVCYYAIVSLQAVVVPFNPALTVREISYMVEDSRMKILLTQAQMELGDSLTQLLIPETIAAAEAKPAEAAPVDQSFDQNHECVIIYTSGTTGFPKGAVLTHRNLISNAQAIGEAIDMTAKDISFAALPMFHSYAWTVCVVAPLLSRHAVVVLEAFSPKDAIALIRDSRCTIVNGVPAMYNLYMNFATPEDFKDVRVFVSGGASLPLEVLKKFEAKTGRAIVEGYGLSEASPVVSLNPMNKCKPGSIGLAIPGVMVRVLDDQGIDVKPMVNGELCVNGPNVMKGYFNRPEDTAKAIVDGWLHTGDVAYRDADGYLYIVDRLKDMIIVGGLNVYPREVEEVIYQFPGIKEAAVVGISDRSHGETVHAFVVWAEGAEQQPKHLSDFLRTNLASYKQPKEIIALPVLPRNAGGKVLKKDLRESLKK